MSTPLGRTRGAYTAAAAFEALGDALLRADPQVDRTSLYLRAESSDFLRFNHARLRQATSVEQANVTLSVERGQRRTESVMSLTGHPELDVQRLQAERAQLIEQLALIPEDPWLRRPDAACTSSRVESGELPDAARVIACVFESAGLRLNQDFVGFYAGGPIVHAFADSLGSRHWHQVESFHFDWCLYHGGDQAVKTVYAGTRWRDEEFVRTLEEAAGRVPLLRVASRRLDPGSYRAALSPAALIELLDTLAWGGFSLKARRTGVSSLMRLDRGEAAFAPDVHLDEAFAGGTAPAFSAEGYARPERVPLIDAGRIAPGGGTLNSARSAAEYGVATNGAEVGESPQALRMGPGAIAEAELLRVLDRGLYVSNLWYLNYSDRQACRMTGMTRYACFWVERGQPVAPVQVMRFDDDVIRLLGSGLVGLTQRGVFTPRGDTYGGRALGSTTAPAAVVEGLRLTL